MDCKKKIILLIDEIQLPYKAAKFLVDNFSADQLLSDLGVYKKEITAKLGDAVFIKLKNAFCEKNLYKVVSDLQKYQIKPVFYGDDEYPKLLENIENPPLVLYTKGDISLLNKKAIAIVGTRRPTQYGRDVTALFSRELSNAGLITVSGLAYGLDMEVAANTLAVKGKTIAVLGGGLDKIYPEQNTNLANEIIKKGGLLVSLYLPGKRPAKYSFLERNRIISGLALGTIIIEAGESSGTLNTANHTIEQGRELFVIPANITSSASRGSNRLIEELPEVYTISPKKVLKVLNIEVKQTQENVTKNQEMEAQQKLIVNALYERDLDFDELQIKTKLDTKCLISLLTRMEINGLIKKLPGNFYSL